MTPVVPGGTGASPAPPASATPLSSPSVVNVGSGQNITGVDIAVASPSDSPTPNAQMLGVANVGQGGSASNVGEFIHRGNTMKVLLFGTGLNGGMTVTLSGPNDIGISNVRGITSVDGIAGVAFDAAVSSSAALGARTVRLRSTRDDVTTFTGGLEVIP